MSSALAAVLAASRQEGFLGPGPIGDHIAHALGMARAVTAPPRRVVDLGSGGGVPGLILATSVWPDATWLLADASHRRTAFLTTAIERLHIDDRVAAWTGRAEELGRDPLHRGRHDLVMARSFGPPPVTAECAAPLLIVGGHLVVSEPPDPSVEVRWPAAGLSDLGLEAEDPPHSPGPAVTSLQQVQLCGDRYPRRTGVPAKRPLW